MDISGPRGEADGLAEGSARAEALGEPGDSSADLDHGVAVAAVLAQQIEVAADETDLVGSGGLGGEGKALEKGVGLAEDPGGGEGAAADHDASGTCSTEHVEGLGGLAHIAVSDDGETALDTIDDTGDALVQDGAGELHLGGSAVDGDGDHTRIGESEGEVRGAGTSGEVVGGGPAEPHLAGEWDGGGGREEGGITETGGPIGGGEGATVEFLNNTSDDASGAGEVGEEFAAAVFLGDLVDGAAHVDVDDGGAVLDGPASPLGHDLGIGPVELHADGLVEGVGASEVEAGGGAAEEALRAEEVGAGEAEPAEFAADRPEGEVAVACDGGEEEGGSETDRAEGEWDGEHRGTVERESGARRRDVLSSPACTRRC